MQLSRTGAQEMKPSSRNLKRPFEEASDNRNAAEALTILRSCNSSILSHISEVNNAALVAPASPASKAQELTAETQICTTISPVAQVRAVGRKWTPKEDSLLVNAVTTFGESEWKKIAENVPSRSHVQCFHRWTQTLVPGSIKGVWSAEEDAQLRQLVGEGGKSWRQIAASIQGRNTHQCRARWKNFLQPDLKKGSWAEEEDRVLLDTHRQLGNQWSAISRRLQGRTKLQVVKHDNTIHQTRHNMIGYTSCVLCLLGARSLACVRESWL
jgi:hypothetical protein